MCYYIEHMGRLFPLGGEAGGGQHKKGQNLKD